MGGAVEAPVTRAAALCPRITQLSHEESLCCSLISNIWGHFVLSCFAQFRLAEESKDRSYFSLLLATSLCTVR